MNEILRHDVPQNDIGQKPVIVSGPCKGEGMILAEILSL
jgi:hypothetical protein